MTIELTDICPYYGISRKQKELRQTETSRLLIENFEEMGCSDCDGIDEDCRKYINPKKEYERFFIFTTDKLGDIR